MSVASAGECGISPYLLQAVSSLTSPGSQSDKSRDPPTSSEMEREQAADKGLTHLLQEMNEPVSALLARSSTSADQVDNLRASSGVEGGMLNTNIQEKLASQIALKQGRSVAASSQDSAPVPDVSMVNVLTALASQHMKVNIKQEEADPYGAMSAPAQAITSTVGADVISSPSENADESSQPQIIIYYNNESGIISTTDTNVAVENPENRDVQSALQNYRIVLQGDGSNSTVTSISNSSMISEANASVFQESPGTFVSSDGDGRESAGAFLNADVNGKESSDSDCPICGDKISGYHYGVYTCESCKGFFKRTVQNKKTFMCHKQGQCPVNLLNRKKCPACRFHKCINVGMKLEAIRQDRTRGGRSSYNGASPAVKPKLMAQARKVKTTEGGDGSTPSDPKRSRTAEDEKGQGQLAAILTHSNTPGPQAPNAAGQPVPELLRDIVNLEALLVEEEVVVTGAGGEEMEEGAFYTYLMQLTELRLYKLVRWARNLPQFGAIATDDQIVLLQNCWSDLLGLSVCWQSVETPGLLAVSATRSISLEQAEGLGFGDVMARLLSIAQSLQRLGVDHFEYVALKVLLLISPDVKGLREPDKIRDYQEKLSEALWEYTSARYTHVPNKYGEMLLRLPELARISFLAKEILLMALPPSLPTCGLLVELLKGENAVKD